jgi:hypothetical protein
MQYIEMDAHNESLMVGRKILGLQNSLPDALSSCLINVYFKEIISRCIIVTFLIQLNDCE